MRGAQFGQQGSDCRDVSRTFARTCEVAVAKAGFDVRRSFALAVLAGLQISLGASFMLVVKADLGLSFAVSQLLGGLCFSLGLFLVAVAGGELFTGNNLMLVGLLEGSFGPTCLLRSLVVVYLGNLAGSLLAVGLVLAADLQGLGGGVVGDAAITVASAKCALPWGTSFFRGVLCNVLVCLAVWCCFSGRSVVDKLSACLLPVAAFVACGFEHCVANMFFLPLGFALASDGSVTLAGIASNLTACTLGNLMGGMVVVAGLYWLALGGRRTEGSGQPSGVAPADGREARR